MGKQKMTPIGIACILLVLLVVAFMVRGSLREPEKIVLPPEPSTTEPSGPTVDNEAVDRVEVRPDTVQSAIEVLARPRVYTRTITVERYWSGGSGVSVITAAAADGWLRLDVTETDGQTRHVITGDDAVYIWYGSSRKVYSGASALTQDAEQGILTYEDILALPHPTAVIWDLAVKKAPAIPRRWHWLMALLWCAPAAAAETISFLTAPITAKHPLPLWT